MNLPATGLLPPERLPIRLQYHGMVLSRLKALRCAPTDSVGACGGLDPASAPCPRVLWVERGERGGEASPSSTAGSALLERLSCPAAGPCAQQGQLNVAMARATGLAVPSGRFGVARKARLPHHDGPCCPMNTSRQTANIQADDRSHPTGNFNCRWMGFLIDAEHRGRSRTQIAETGLHRTQSLQGPKRGQIRPGILPWT
jgi:hypothetical protein